MATSAFWNQYKFALYKKRSYEMSMIHRNTNQNEYFPIMRIPFGN